MARLWRNQRAMVLNDDRIVVREDRGKSDVRYALARRFQGFSQRGNAHQQDILSLPRQRKPAYSSRRSQGCFHVADPILSAPLDKEGMIFTLAFCHQMVSTVPSYEFHFKQDQSVVDFVRNAA